MSVQQLAPGKLQEWLSKKTEALFLLDVREVYEYERARIEGSVLIPMQEIPENMATLDKQQAIVVICHHGIRSGLVADFLARNGFANVFNLQGGIDAWSCLCDPDVPRY